MHGLCLDMTISSGLYKLKLSTGSELNVSVSIDTGSEAPWGIDPKGVETKERRSEYTVSNQIF